MNMALTIPIVVAVTIITDSTIENRLPPRNRPKNPPMLPNSSMRVLGVNSVTYNLDS